MSKTTPISIRFDSPTKTALEKIAKADHRSVSSLVGKIVAEWMERQPVAKGRGGRK